jgi:hypothetical protein
MKMPKGRPKENNEVNLLCNQTVLAAVSQAVAEEIDKVGEQLGSQLPSWATHNRENVIRYLIDKGIEAHRVFGTNPVSQYQYQQPQPQPQYQPAPQPIQPAPMPAPPRRIISPEVQQIGRQMDKIVNDMFPPPIKQKKKHFWSGKPKSDFPLIDPSGWQ